MSETIGHVMMDNYRFYRSDAAVGGQGVYILELRARDITINVNMLRGLAVMLQADIVRVLTGKEVRDV